jgi:hypothetical protein
MISDPDQKARPYEIKQALRAKQDKRKNRQDRKRRNAPARKHAIVDLQHIK